MYQDLRSIITDYSDVNSYILFREIEDWCLDNIDGTKWRLDYSTFLNVYGVDIPIGIQFKEDKDFTAFKLRFFVT